MSIPVSRPHVLFPNLRRAEHCEVCGVATKEQKPYCSDHIYLLPQVAALLAKLRRKHLGPPDEKRKAATKRFVFNRQEKKRKAWRAALASVLSAVAVKKEADLKTPCELCGNTIHESSALCRRCELRLRADDRVGRANCRRRDERTARRKGSAA